MSDEQGTGILGIRQVERLGSAHVPHEKQLEELGLPKPPKGVHEFDKEDSRKRFAKVHEWWQHELLMQSESRRTALEDHDIYDGPGQWTEEELKMLRDRGQLPITLNQVKPTVDWVTGTEKKVRIDYRVMPRGPEDARGADVKTKLLKYISDTNNLGFRRSKAFADAVISGIGWLDFNVSNDPDEEIVKVRYEDWRNVWLDSLSVEEDMSDARYVFRGKWVDEDIAIAIFPDRADVIQSASGKLQSDYNQGLGDPAFDSRQSGSIMNESGPNSYSSSKNVGILSSLMQDVTVGNRRRVFIVECWYKTPARKQVLRGKQLGTINGIDYDPKNENHKIFVDHEIAEVVDTVKMEARHMIFLGKYVLLDRKTPFLHNRFPLVPIWGYRRKLNNTPYGMVRNLRDPQKDLNKRRSKALYILSSNRIIADEEAVADGWQEAIYQVARPDGVVKLKRKPEGQPWRFELIRDNALADQHVQLMVQDEKYIQNSSGVTDELMGRDTNAVSGKAIVARQEQGHVVTQQLFDNYRLAFKMSGEILLSLIEQFYTDEKTARIVGPNDKVDFVTVNETNPETGETMNDVTVSQADFVISEQDYSATLRKAMFETLAEMITKLPPEAAMQLLDIVFELSDLPGKDKLVERMRKINGQPATDETTDPEEMRKRQEAEQAQQQAQAEEEAMQKGILQAQLEHERAKVAKIAEDVKLISAKINTEMVQQRVAAAGVDYDKERVKIEKAKTLDKIDQTQHQKHIDMETVRQTDEKLKTEAKKALVPPTKAKPAAKKATPAKKKPKRK